MDYQLYIDALALPCEEREIFVRAQCDDEGIVSKVLSLLSTEKSVFTLSDQLIKESHSYGAQQTTSIGDIISVYRLTEYLGQGGMGSVFKALRIDGRFEQTVAIKVISPLLSSLFDSNKLASEANFMAKLNHHNICSVYDAGITEDGLHYIVMEYLHGAEVSTYFTDQDITLKKKLAVFSTLCDAVNYAHQMQVIHGDLKPENVIIDHHQQVKVLDFGISQAIVSADGKTEEGERRQFHGISKGFASPELVNGEKPTIYSDVYALGKILANLAAHSRSSYDGNYRQIKAIVNQATALLPTDRYASVSELRQDITLLLNGHVVSAYQASKGYKVKKFVIERHPVSMFVGLVFTLTLSVLVANLFLQYQQLTFEKKQTDLMLEKFSLVLDLDLDRKSNIELSLANNYQSRGEDEKAAALYHKIISRFDKLQNTDIAFNAGGRLLALLINNKQYELIDPTLAPLENKLRFLAGGILPISATQAMFYHHLINTRDDRPSKEQDEIFTLHRKLMRQIKETYWQTLSSSQKKSLNFSLARGSGQQTLSQLQRSIYYQSLPENELSTLQHSFSRIFKDYFTSPNIYLPKQENIEQFLESQWIVYAGTHVNDVENEALNRAWFSQGITRIEDAEGVYRVDERLLINDFGEGEESDFIFYLSERLALSVYMEVGDVMVLYPEQASVEKKPPVLNRETLLARPWYHIYDRSLKKDDAVLPSLMKIEFNTLTATLIVNEQSQAVPWNINKQGGLEFHFAKNELATLKLQKVLADDEIIVIKNPDTGVHSLLVNNEILANYILNSWQTFI